MRTKLFILTLFTVYCILQNPLSAQNSGVKGLNDYAKTHTIYTGTRYNIKYGYLPWNDDTWTDLNGNQVPASAIYKNIEPIGSGLFMAANSLVVDESGKLLFSGSDFSAKVYSNLLYLENCYSNIDMYGLMSTAGKEIVPYESMTKEQFYDKIRRYIEENPTDSLNINLQMYLSYPNSQIIRLGGKYYLRLLDEYKHFSAECVVVDMVTGQNVTANLKEEEVFQKLKDISGHFQDLQGIEEIKQYADRDTSELDFVLWGDELFLVRVESVWLIADSKGRVLPFRKDDVYKDGKKRPNEYELKEPIICGSKIWYRCFNSTHQVILDYQDNIVCSWPKSQDPDYVNVLTDKLFCLQYGDGRVTFYTEDFNSNSTTPLLGETKVWNETEVPIWMSIRGLVKK